MMTGIYYHILEIGVIYEKGGKEGKLWRIGERKKLNAECKFWKNILNYVMLEKKGIDCSLVLFEELQELKEKYHLESYQRILSLKEKLVFSQYNVEVDDGEGRIVYDLICELLDDLEAELQKWTGKDDVYRILRVLHNLPKFFHGKDELGGDPPLAYSNVMKYAAMSMSEEMKKKFEKYII